MTDAAGPPAGDRTATPLPYPTGPALPLGEVLLRYLDHFREAMAATVRGLDERQARTSVLPSGWSPLELVSHLTNVERRWLVWGFEGEHVDDPWADERDGRWQVADDATVEDVVQALERQGQRTREVVRAHRLSDVGAPSERWDGAPPPALERVLLHLLQEHARHAGHLEIVRELLTGVLSED